jgi:hypothetical protein
MFITILQGIFAKIKINPTQFDILARAGARI